MDVPYWKSLTLLGMLNLLPAPAYPFIAWDMRLGSMQRWKECDSRRVGCAKAIESGSSLMLVSKYGKAERGHTWKSMDMCRDR